MKYLGFSENLITWLKSYLSERKFKRNINTRYSSLSNLACGIPQGSTLGPHLFLVYVNDFPKAVVSDSVIYADGTCIVFQHKNATEIEKQQGIFQVYVTGLLIINYVYILAKTKQNQFDLIINTDFEMLRP